MSPTRSAATRSTRLGERFVDSDYWSGQMMAEVERPRSTPRAGRSTSRSAICPRRRWRRWRTSCTPPSGPPAAPSTPNRGHDYRTHDVEMHISEIGLCGGHSASGVWVDEHARTTVPGLYAAGDLACVPHNYMIGAFVYGELAGAHAASTLARSGCAAAASGRSAGRGARAGVPAAAPSARVRRSRRWSTSCGASSTTTWRRPRAAAQAVARRARPSSGCAARSRGWARARRTS